MQIQYILQLICEYIFDKRRFDQIGFQPKQACVKLIITVFENFNFKIQFIIF